MNRIDEIVASGPSPRGPRADRRHPARAPRAAARERRLDLEVTRRGQGVARRPGYDPAFGARPLKRVIQRYIGDPLAVSLLEGRFAEGDTVHVDVAADGDSLTFG